MAYFAKLICKEQLPEPSLTVVCKKVLVGTRVLIVLSFNLLPLQIK